MAEDGRPSSSTETAQGDGRTIPVAAWLLACTSLGLAGGAALFVAVVTSDLCGRAFLCVPLPPPTFSVTLAYAFLAGALAFALLPTRGGPPAALKGAGALAIVAGVVTIALLLFQPVHFDAPKMALVTLSLGLPAAAIGAMDPVAKMGSKVLATPTGWLRAGALVGGALALSIYAGYGVLEALQRSGEFWAPLADHGVGLVWRVAAALLLLAGALAVRSARAHPSPAEPAAKAGGAVRRRIGLTPMLRYHLIAETSLVVALGASLAAVADGVWLADAAGEAALAVAVGAVVGAAFFGAASPTLDKVLGRGRFLSTVWVAGAAGPLLVASYLADGTVLWLAVAAALFAYAICSAPQRYALVFDLCPSKSRLRSSLDFHAIRMASGAAGVAGVVWGEGLLSSLGLLLASAYGVLGLAIFTPTLGQLGRRPR